MDRAGVLSPSPGPAGGAALAGRPGALHAAALLSAMLAAVALPPLDLAFLGWVAWAPWLALLARGPSVKHGFTSGLVHGLALHALACHWIYVVLREHGGLPWPAAAASFLLALAVLAPWSALVGAAAALACRAHGVLGLLVVPLAWPALDAVRERLAMGFPWVTPALTQARSPVALGLAGLGGAAAVTAVLLCASVALAALLALPAGGRRARLTAAVATGLAGLGIAAGAGRAVLAPRHLLPAAVAMPLVLDAAGREVIDSSPPPPPWPAARVPGELRAILIQAAVPQEMLFEALPEDDHQRALLHLDLTRRALEMAPDVVVWSESSHPASLRSAPYVLSALRQQLAAHELATGARVQVVLGALVDVMDEAGVAPVGWTNSALLVDASGLVGRQDKVHLVPFGERVPAWPLLWWVPRLVPAAGNLLAGRDATPLPGDRARMGALVCYGAVFPHHVRRLVRSGAEVLVNITNDGWFHGTAAPEQHLRFSRLRAAESGRALLRCANSGISVVIGPDGAEVARLAEGERGLLAARLMPARSRPPAVRLGDAPVAAAGLVALGWLAAAAWRAGGRGREPAAGGAA